MGAKCLNDYICQFSMQVMKKKHTFSESDFKKSSLVILGLLTPNILWIRLQATAHSRYSGHNKWLQVLKFSSELNLGTVMGNIVGHCDRRENILVSTAKLPCY